MDARLTFSPNSGWTSESSLRNADKQQNIKLRNLMWHGQANRQVVLDFSIYWFIFNDFWP